MESNTRSLWIFVAVVALGLLLCAAAITLIGVGVVVLPKGVGALGGDRIERSFEVGAAPLLDVSNFSGGVTVRAGQSGAIQVVAVKKGLTQTTRNNIQVEMTEQAGGLRIKTQTQPGLNLGGSVELDITVPADARLTLHTGSGGVTVEGLTGSLTVETGSGGIDLRNVKAVDRAQTGSGGIAVQGAAGPIRLQTGSGGIDYEGMPQGECHFQTGSGSITLALPADLNATVDLSTGSGSIDTGFSVTGQVGSHKVQGTIGSGDQAQIYAQTGSGSIEFRKQ